VSDESTAGPDLGSKHLVTHVADRVLHVRIDRVEARNAFTQDMYRGIKRAAVWADQQPELDAVCLTGTDEWFGAGGDLAGRKEDPDGLAAEWDGTDHFPFRHIERCRKIWVAKINGACHAGGLGIVLHCDASVASDRATFRVPELLRGIPDPFMSARLVDAVGLVRARHLFFTAARFDAAAAAAMGVVGEVVAHDELDARTDWVLDQVRNTGPVARAAIKRDINSQLRPADLTLFQGLGLRAELAEGMGAFVAKRPVEWPRPAQ
jgi:enoyl-CoA hydratase/carnithine racemase